MKLLYCLLAFPCLQSSAQNPLNIGDTVPNISLTNIINHHTPTAQLHDFKGKILILDFWGQYCSSCILALPKLDSLQQLYKQNLQIITIADFTDTTHTRKALSHFSKTKNLKLPVIPGSSQLKALFPHTLVSHIVWIDSNGIYRAATGSEYVTASNIQLFETGTSLNWPVKKDVMDFDQNAPLLKSTQSPPFLYYSCFTAHLPGISPPGGTTRNQSANTTTTRFYNLSLLKLCQLAADYSVVADTNKFILQVKDRTRFQCPATSYYTTWAQNNTYCYEAILPDTLSEVAIQEWVQADLTRWLLVQHVYIKRIPGIKTMFLIIDHL